MVFPGQPRERLHFCCSPLLSIPYPTPPKPHNLIFRRKALFSWRLLTVLALRTIPRSDPGEVFPEAGESAFPPAGPTLPQVLFLHQEAFRRVVLQASALELCVCPGKQEAHNKTTGASNRDLQLWSYWRWASALPKAEFWPLRGRAQSGRNLSD